MKERFTGQDLNTNILFTWYKSRSQIQQWFCAAVASNLQRNIFTLPSKNSLIIKLRLTMINV